MANLQKASLVYLFGLVESTPVRAQSRSRLHFPAQADTRVPGARLPHSIYRDVLHAHTQFRHPLFAQLPAL